MERSTGDVVPIGAVSSAGGAAEPGPPIRLFLVDDAEMVRVGLADLLTTRGNFVVVGQAGTIAGAREGILETLPDVALLDVRLPDGSGIQLCRELRSSAPTVRCALLTSFDESNAAVAAVLSGAYGFFLKEIESVDLSAALRQIANGRSALDADLTARALDALRGEPPVDPSSVGMTRRETAIQEMLLEGLNDAEIAERLGMPERSVRVYVAEVLAKVIETL
jgi:two-component system response regulator DevR